MFAWATSEYMLNYMTLEEVFFYYEQGIKFEEFRAQLIISKLGEALDGNKKKRQLKGPNDDKPDKQKFYKHYGDQIERPGKGGE